MSRLSRISLFLLCLLAFAGPIEHKYDKLFRFFSLTLIPEGLVLPKWFDKKIYFYLSDIAALFLSIFALVKGSIADFFRKGENKYLWGIFAFSILSIALSPLYNYPIAYSRLLQFLTPILLFCALPRLFAKGEMPKVSRALFMAFFLAATVQALFGTLQYFLQSPLGLRFLSESGNFSTIPMETGHRWIFDSLFSLKKNSVLFRAQGTFSNTNMLGGFLMASLLLFYPLFFTLKKTWEKRLFTLLFAFQLFALWLTFSRAAIFGWALGTLIWFYLTAKKKKLSFLITLTLSCTLLNTLLLYEPLLARGGLINNSAVSRASNQERLDLQEQSYAHIQKHLFFGVGFQEYSYRTGVQAPHNIFLFLLAETGIFSLACFLLFLFSLMKRAFFLASLEKKATFFALLFAYCFIGLCDFYPLFFQNARLMYFILFGLLASEETAFDYQGKQLENVR